MFNIIKNKKGATLINVISAVSLLSIVTVSITQVTANRDFVASIKEENVINEHLGKQEIAKSTIEIEEFFGGITDLSDIENVIATEFETLEQEYNIRITDVTEDYLETGILDDTVEIAKVYEIGYPYDNPVLGKKMYINSGGIIYQGGVGDFAIVSDSDITINGGAYFDGRIAANNYYLSNEIFYYDYNLDLINNST